MFTGWQLPFGTRKILPTIKQLELIFLFNERRGLFIVEKSVKWSCLTARNIYDYSEIT